MNNPETNENENVGMEINLRTILAANEFLGRRAYAATTAREKDIYTECGYPRPEELTISGHYKPMYKRNPVASRVVNIFPDKCWAAPPRIYENKDANNTKFEDQLEELSTLLSDESSFKQEQGNPLFKHLKKVDRISGIGHYGVLFIGFNDGEDLSKPVEPREGMKVNYVSCFDESQAQIVRYVRDRSNKRNGKPEAYNINFFTHEGGGTALESRSTDTQEVHWSRVIHIAEPTGDSETFAIPRQQIVFNNLINIDVLSGGSTEMYWTGAKPPTIYGTDPALGGNTDADFVALAKQIDEMELGLRRNMGLEGFQAYNLQTQVVDPTKHIDKQIGLICIYLPCPKRIFEGSERGELASGQDKGEFNYNVRGRQETYCSPDIVAPFIDRLILFGVLEKPEEYFCEWPDLESQTTEEKSANAVRITEALAKYVMSGASALISEEDYLSKVLCMDPEEVETILDNLEEPDDKEEVEGADDE